MRRFSLLLLLLLYAPLAAGRASIKVLPAADIKALKQKPCTFVHVWATWCTICIQEMPAVLKILSSLKQVRPVIIDVSAPGVQKGFSKPWMQKLAPPFTTYLKPDGDDGAYLSAIDSEWSGALPFSALYDKGKRKHTWTGELNLQSLKGEISRLCK